MNTLYFLLLNSLFIWGIHTMFLENNLLDGLGKLIEKTIGTFWAKPLILCPGCMSSFWGTIGFFLFVPLEVYYWPIYCISLCGLNVIINKLTSNVIEIEE